ncbi:TetR/AcrR family transcriptional regulator [Gluconobacter albidus]|uniref:TetR/AcrR family transcriptional regulator n=1 Tax=Gluconobacter albidus TaxID=318683 RepID=UPI0030A95C78
MEAAARILEGNGATGYTTNAIAVLAGVSIGSLYQYFPNKAAITRALIRRELRSLEDHLGPIFAAPLAPGALAEFAFAAATYQMRRPALARRLDEQEELVAAPDDLAPSRERIMALLSAVMQGRGVDADAALLDDLMAVARSLTDAAGHRGETDIAPLARRIEFAMMAVATAGR